MFQAKWIERREFWNDKMERRYKHRRKELWPKLPLKVRSVFFKLPLKVMSIRSIFLKQ